MDKKESFFQGKGWVASLLATGLGSSALMAGSMAVGWSDGSLFSGRGFGRMGWGVAMGHGPGMAVFGLLGLLLIVGLVVAATRRHPGLTGEGRASFPDPLADLAEAYAQGTITREQYIERKSVLEESL